MNLISVIQTDAAKAYREALQDATTHLTYGRARVGHGKGRESTARTNSSLSLQAESTLEVMCRHIFAEALIKYLDQLPAFCRPVIAKDEGYQLLKYGRGEKYDIHVDAGAQHLRLVSAVLYVNDDYAGGELQFPLQKKKIKPKAGSVILFPSNYCYPHTSLPITKGTKYSVVTWFF